MKVIIAKFPGMCSACGSHIYVGDRIVLLKPTREGIQMARHERCQLAFEALRKGRGKEMTNYYCLLKDGFIPLCGFDSVEQAREYQQQHQKGDWEIHIYAHGEYRKVVEG